MRECDKSSILDSIFVQSTIFQIGAVHRFQINFWFRQLKLIMEGPNKHQKSQTTQRRLHLNEV